MLFLADVDRQVVALVRHSDNLPRIYGRRGIDEHRAAVLRIEQTVGRRFSRFESDERAVCSSRDLSFERLITVEYGTHNAFAARVGKKFVSVTEKSTGGDKKFKSCSRTYRAHVQQFAFSFAHFAHNRADRRFGYVCDKSFKRFAANAVYCFEKHFRGRYLELVPLAAHGLHKY